MRSILPSMPRDVAQRILNEEHGDLKARWILNVRAEQTFEAGQRKAFAILMHAEAYLADREEYTANPHPKNMVKLILPPKCSHMPLTKRDPKTNPRGQRSTWDATAQTAGKNEPGREG